MIAIDNGPGLFSSIAGLPLHPLVVHLAVVVLPAAALALIVLVAVRRWRRRYGWLAVGAALLGTAGAFVAKESGESLAAQVGMPAEHAEWGDRLFVAAVAFSAVTVIWFVLELRRGRPRVDDGAGAPSPGPSATGRSDGSTLRRVAGGSVVTLSVVVLALTVVVGHSGATAVWGGRTAAFAGAPVSGVAEPTTPGRSTGTPSTPTTTSAAPSSNPASSPSTSRSTGTTSPVISPSSSPTPSPPAGPAAYTLAQVEQHTSNGSCWVAIDASVYDLTQWIGQHPGGPEPIQGICGTDASAAFHAQHGTQAQPARELATFKIGALS